MADESEILVQEIAGRSGKTLDMVNFKTLGRLEPYGLVLSPSQRSFSALITAMKDRNYEQNPFTLGVILPRRSSKTSSILVFTL